MVSFLGDPCCTISRCLRAAQLHGIHQFALFRTVSIATMPKDQPKAVTELRHIRLKHKAARADRPPLQPSRLSLQVLGNGAKGSPRALYVFTDQTRYLFNCSEGTQRLAHEHKLKLSKLEHIFFTYKSWENLSGLPGLALTVQEIGVPEITIHGPPGIENIFGMTQSFMATDYLRVKNHSDVTFADNCMQVTYVPLYSDEASDSKLGCEVGLNGVHVALESPNLSEQMGKPSENSSKDVAIAYICKAFKKPGALNLWKCMELGVPRGPLLGQLKNKQDVVLPNGTVVRAEQVVSPDEPGPIFIVIECPRTSFLTSLLNSNHFIPHQNTATAEEDVATAVIHFTPPEVMCDPRYLSWIKKFPSTTSHIVINESNPSLSSLATHRIQHKLHLVHPRLFPLLQSAQESAEERLPLELKDTVVQSSTLMEIHLRPPRGVCEESSIHLAPDVYLKEAKDAEGFQESLEALQGQLNAIQHQDEVEYPEIAFLGTGSMIPSKVRNVSSILINIQNDVRMMLDCGEGTYSQLFHLYASETDSVLLQLRCVFISHLHADHHLGLIEIIKQRERAYAKAGKPYSQLIVLAPQQVIAWLEKYHEQFEPIRNYFQCLSTNELKYQMLECDEKFPDLLSALALKDMVTVPVRHCKNACGIVLTFLSDFKLVYSGDTMPCDGLIKAGQGCDVLIHEATMEDDLLQEAIIKRHSTTSQAIEVGNKMQAKFVILTHFSQRYSKIPMFNENFHHRVGIAFDNMKVKPKDLPTLPLLIPTLKCLFSEDYEEMQERTDKRLKRQKLIQQASSAPSS